MIKIIDIILQQFVIMYIPNIFLIILYKLCWIKQQVFNFQDTFPESIFQSRGYPANQ